VLSFRHPLCLQREEAEAAAKLAAEAADDLSDDEGTTTIRAGPVHDTQAPEALAAAIASQHASAARDDSQNGSTWPGSITDAKGSLAHADGQQQTQHGPNGSGASVSEKERTS
jgi:hypothetical protein